MLECIRFEQGEKYIRDFLNIPKQLYSATANMENPKEVEKLLLGTHPLSTYFTLHKFLVYKGQKAVGRFVITVYPEDETAYIGFFECIEDKEVAERLFKEAVDYAARLGFKKLVGPVDASFWIRYRLKINLFDRVPYTGEPYNKEYYFKLFQDNGFKVVQHYTSSIYNRVENMLPLYSDRYRTFLDKGYEIIRPDVRDFDKLVKELYELITDLYSDFPIYKNIDYEDFAKVFSDYRYIINMDMVRMAYYKGQAVGFFISVPDYGNAVYHLKSLHNLFKLFAVKRKPKQYVMLYMGVHREHQGLGKALAGSIMEELVRSGLTSIGALARDGKVTQEYAKEQIEQYYEYVLLEKGW